MCNIGKHTCYCKQEYTCDLPNWLCSTINDDEDANMCDDCLDKMAEDIQAFVDKQEESIE